MNDESSPAEQDESRLDKLHASQSELLVKIKQRQESERLLHLLVFRLSMLVESPDPILTNNLQVLRKALQEGEDLLHLNSLVKDISDRIRPQVTKAVTSVRKISNKSTTDDAETQEQVYLIHDVLLVLLENINFPSAFSEEINKIIGLLKPATGDKVGFQVLAGITALAEVLDDIFCAVKDDNEKVSLFMKKANIDLQNMDEEIAESSSLQTEKKKTDDEINIQVETQMLEMENALANHGDVDQIKTSVQGSVNTIRNQMENFKQSTAGYDQQASAMMERLRSQLSNMECQYEEFKRQVLEKNEPSLSDPITGIRNRLAYEEAIYQEIERYKRYGRPFTLLMFDLDNFKEINDSIGESAGDKVLQGVAHIMAANIRSVDFLARYGGDEFVIILPELAKEDGKRVAAKICKALQEKSFDIGEQSNRITVSGGIATIKADDTIESLFQRVDLALSLAKEKGRNRYEVD